MVRWQRLATLAALIGTLGTSSAGRRPKPTPEEVEAAFASIPAETLGAYINVMKRDMTLLHDPRATAFKDFVDWTGGFIPPLPSTAIRQDNIRSIANAWCEDRAATEKEYGHISTWDTSFVTDMTALFQGKMRFDEDITNWNVENVHSMANMFNGARDFRGHDLSKWDTSKVSNTAGMFHRATSFVGNISAWDMSSVRSMRSMFWGASTFAGDLSRWDVGQCTSMRSMFHDATAFNANITAWKIDQVADMENMFNSAISFQADLRQWPVAKSAKTKGMFSGALAYNRAYGDGDGGGGIGGGGRGGGRGGGSSGRSSGGGGGAEL